MTTCNLTVFLFMHCDSSAMSSRDGRSISKHCHNGRKIKSYSLGVHLTTLPHLTGVLPSKEEKGRGYLFC